MGELGLEEQLMILNPLKKLIRSYDILNDWWTHFYFENVAHCKFEFGISLRTNKTVN